MKKLLLGMLAIVAMVATSCQQEVDLGVNAGETATVSFNINAPASRAYSDGTTATVLQYAVYDANGTELTALTKSLEKQNAETINISTTVNLQLVTGNTYAVIFWAAAPNAPYTVNFAEQSMTVDYSNAASNDENRDAFYKYHTFTVKGAQTETIELRRPFAQLNIGTNDYDAAASAGYTPETSWVTVKNIYTTLDLNEGKVSNPVAVTFAESAIPTTETFPVSGHEYLAMNYLLVNERENIEVEFSYKDADAAVQGEETKTRTVGSVPVERNHRTNLYGSILTSDVAINVIIKPEYETPDHEADALYLAAATGGEITLTEDIVLTTPLNIQHNLSINLNGKTISAALAKGDGAVVEIAEGIKTEIVGGTIKNTTENGDAAINNAGTLVLKNVAIEGAPLADGGYSAYAVISSGNLVIEEGTTVSADRGCLKFSGAGETVINGGHFTNNDIGTRNLTSHVVDVEDGGTHKLTINGGTFQHLHSATSGGVVICNRTRGTVYVNGGNFSGGNYYGNDNLSDYGYGGTFAVTGGVYTAKPAAKYIAAGYAVVEKDGVYVVAAAANDAETLATAITNGGLVVLAEDIATTEAIQIPAGATATIDLNGKTLTATTTDAFVVKTGANVTISNGKVVAHAGLVRAEGGKVVIEGGEFVQTGHNASTPATNRYGVDSRDGGELIVKGGTFTTINGMFNVSANSSLVVEGGNFNNAIERTATRHFAYVAGNLTIKGGVFESKASGSGGGCFFCGAGANGKVTVEGGKFTSLWNNGSKNNIWESYFGGSIEVKGGIFNHNGGIKAQVIENTDAATKDAYPYMAK